MKDDDDDDDSAARPLKLTCPCRRLCLLPPVYSALCSLHSARIRFPLCHRFATSNKKKL